MPSLSTFVLFTVSTLAILAVPGPSVMFVIARTLEHGRTAGLVSVLGIETGALVHVAVASAGLSAFVASSPTALTTLRYVGGAYLLWLAAQALRRGSARAGDRAPASGARLFRQGLLVDLLNPKTGLFFLGFLPGYVDPARGPVAAQVALLGLCFVALATLTDGAYALAAARMSRKARGGSAHTRLAGAGTYGLLGVLAFSGAL